MIGLLVALLIIGILFYFLPLDPVIKTWAYRIIGIVVAVALLIWVLGLLGVWHPGQKMHLGLAVGTIGVLPALRLDFYQWQRRTRENLAIWVANHVPRWLAYRCAIRVAAHATTGKWSDQEVPALTLEQLLKRWDQ